MCTGGSQKRIDGSHSVKYSECINRILTSRKESAKIVSRTAYTIYACGLDENVSDRKCLVHHVQDLIGLLPFAQSQV